VTAEWLVALEATAAPDALDVDALARRLGALGDCRPEEDSDRYVVMLREPGEEPVDALRGAVTRFEEAAGAVGRTRARLVGARLVSSSEGVRVPATADVADRDPASAARGSKGGRARAWLALPGVRVGVLAVLLLAAAGGLAWRLLGDGSATRPSLSSRGQLTARDRHNLLPRSSLDTRTGLAVGVRSWGGVRATVVRAGGTTGQWVEQVQVTPGLSGGIFAETAAQPGVVYDQSALVRVLSLDPGTRVELVVEWYDAGRNLVGYHMLPVTSLDGQLLRRAQTVQAPSGTAAARFLVNATGGATYMVANTDMAVAPPGSTPSRP
jgi:hypothetical protein